ncbi:MAG: cardiolipin synthase [Clostridium sp.]
MMDFNIYILLLGFYLFINILFSFSLIFIERKDPTTTWAWLLIFVMLPGVGFVIYMLLGQNFSRQKIFKQKRVIDQAKRRELSKRFSKTDLGEHRNVDYVDLIRMNYNNSGAAYTSNNNVKTYIDGEEKLKQLLIDLEGAKKYINIQYYIFKKDLMGKPIVELLEKKLQEGVEVRLLVDSMGSRTITKHKLKKYLKYGGKFSIFFPGILPHINTRINYRNHRKIVVIDGEIGYTGGFNIGSEYINKDKKVGYWRDTHVRIEGEAVKGLNERFLLDWCHASEEDIEDFDTFDPIEKKEYGDVGVQVVTSGPDHNEEYIKNAYMKMINNAKRNLFLTTPYFVPDEPILEALKISALSGVDVRLIIPGKPDHRFMMWAASSYIGELLSCGVKVYYYMDGFVHAKTIVVDSSVVTIGTANMDIRSFKLNFEVNAFIYDDRVAVEAEKQFIKDMERSIEITTENYINRSKWLKIKESIIRLVAPIL